MASYLDGVPLSGIIRIRDMMYSVENPFRLDQGDVSFDVPDTVKVGMTRAIAENRTHYLQTNGVPRLRELLAEKLRRQNGIANADPEHILVTNGGIHGLYIACHALLEPGDEIAIPDPAWPPVVGNILLAKGVPRPCRLHESLGWRYDLDELERSLSAEDAGDLHQLPEQPDRRHADARGPGADRGDREVARSVGDFRRGVRGRRLRRRARQHRLAAGT